MAMEMTMQSLRRISSGRGCFFKREEGTKPINFLVCRDIGGKSVGFASSLSEPDTFDTRSIISHQSLIESILCLSGTTQIYDPVIEWVAIDVINNFWYGRSIDQQPREAVRREGDASDIDPPIVYPTAFVAIAASRQFTSKQGIPAFMRFRVWKMMSGSRPPCESASVRIVNKTFADKLDIEQFLGSHAFLLKGAVVRGVGTAGNGADIPFIAQAA